MEWYTNGVTNAIVECRQKMALFIVYVKDSSDASQKTTQSWQNEQVLDVLSNNLYVALEIIKDSTEFQQFSELFPVLVVPSIFCISPTGQQLSVGSGLVDSVHLCNILHQGFQQMRSSFTTGPQPVTTSRSISEEDLDDETDEVSLSPSEQKEETQSEETKEEKAKRYQEKIKQQKIKREQQEKQHEISSELKRRREGQKIGEIKKEQEDREKQNWLKERQKEKVEQMRARQEVLAKLEQDKQERLAQKKKTNVTTTTTTDTELRSRSSGVTSSPVTAVPSVFSAVRNSSCRIQVKLPDGHSTVLLLGATDTVGLLRDKIAEYIQVERQKISITCVYPRKELGIDLDDTNLDQHGLVPSGVILARTKTYKETRQLSGQSAGGVLGMLLGLLHFIMQIFVTIKNGIIGLFWSSSTQVTTNRPVSRSSDDNTRIRRFKPDDYKDQDDNNTYNGNSTQQQ